MSEKLRAAARQALEALKAGLDFDPIFAGEAEGALRAALPVAWLDQDINCAYTAAEMDGDSTEGLVPLYTAPPQRDALLEALRFIANHDLRGADLTACGHIAHGLIGKARDAIKAAEGDKE